MKSGFAPSQNAYVDVMPTPGATMSGFRRPSPVGPRLLKGAIVSSVRTIVFMSFIAPTERMLNPAPGRPTVRGPGRWLGRRVEDAGHERHGGECGMGRVDSGVHHCVIPGATRVSGGPPGVRVDRAGDHVHDDGDGAVLRDSVDPGVHRKFGD